MTSYWTCRRKEDGIQCRRINPNRNRKCLRCGAPKPPKRQPKHMVALELSYEQYIVLNGGEHCALCLRIPGEGQRRLQRDHDHGTGRPRGLLCVRCNRQLAAWITPEWLTAAAEYVQRTAA